LFYSYSIRAKRIAVKKAGGAPDENGSLLKTLTKGGKDKTISSSYRWAVGATAEGDLQLQLQVIPLPAKEVKATPLLCEDNVAAAVPRAWPIGGPTFRGAGGLAGPIPILFSTEPGELGGVLYEDPDPFKKHLNSIMKR
jgi:hypothetical protein